jgi:hypothetical protein
VKTPHVNYAIPAFQKAKTFLFFLGNGIYPTGIGFPVFPVTYSDIFYFFLRSLIADKLPEEEK